MQFASSKTILVLAPLFAVALCACGGDDSGNGDVDASADATTDATIDASSDATATDATADAQLEPALECLGEPFPTVPASIDITVALRTRGDGSDNYEGSTITVYKRSDDAVVESKVADANGEATFTLETGGAPLDVYFGFEIEEHPDWYAYTAWPLFESEKIGFAVSTAEFVNQVVALTGATPDPEKGHLLVTARDCDLRPLEDAELTLTADFETLEYPVGEDCDTIVSDLSQTGSCGQMLAANVEPGSATLSGGIPNGPQLWTQQVVIKAGAVTRLSMRPDRTLE